MKLSSPYLIAAFHLLFITALLIAGRHAPVGDWGNYYYGATAYTDENAQEIYDVTSFNQYVDAQQSPGNSFLSYTQIPPLSLLVYLPFTLLKIGTAKLFFTLITYLLCAFSVTRLFKKIQLDLKWSLLLPLLFLLPFRSNVDAGQSYFLLIALLAEGWLARENGKWLLAGFLFAVAIHLKIFPAIVLLWLLAEKDWRIAGATIAAVGIIFGLSLLYVDWEIWKYYGSEVLPRLAKGEITNTYATAYQSVPVLLKQLFVPDALHNPSVVANSDFAWRFGTLVWTGIVLVLAFLFSRDKKQSSYTRFAIWIFAGMLISGYGSTYGLLFLIFPAIAIFKTEMINRNKKIVLLALVALISNIPMSRMLDFAFPFSFLRLFFMLCFFAGLIYVFRPRWNKLALIVLIIPLLSLINGKSTEIQSDYFLKQEPSLLITEFHLSGDTVIYTYRDGNGLHKARTLFPEHVETVQEKPASPHAVIWENAEYPFPGENIRGMMVINNNYFLYLSDRNRGVGFYTLRIKKISPEVR